MISDEPKLIRRLKAHDEAAFREMVREYQHRVFSLVFRMLGNRAEAEDLAQEIFISVFKNIVQFREECKFSTWLLRITANHCKNRHKYLCRRAYRSTTDLDSHEAQPGRSSLYPNSPTPEQLLEGAELEQAIQRGINELDEDHRLLIILRDVQGMSYQEIGEITQLPEGTIKSKLHRGRLALKEQLKGYL